MVFRISWHNHRQLLWIDQINSYCSNRWFMFSHQISPLIFSLITDNSKCGKQLTSSARLRQKRITLGCRFFISFIKKCVSPSYLKMMYWAGQKFRSGFSVRWYGKNANELFGQLNTSCSLYFIAKFKTGRSQENPRSSPLALEF